MTSPLDNLFTPGLVAAQQPQWPGGPEGAAIKAAVAELKSFPPGHCGCWAATNPGVKRLSSEEFIGIRVENLGVFAQANYPKKISASL